MKSEKKEKLVIIVVYVSIYRYIPSIYIDRLENYIITEYINEN